MRCVALLLEQHLLRPEGPELLALCRDLGGDGAACAVLAEGEVQLPDGAPAGTIGIAPGLRECDPQQVLALARELVGEPPDLLLLPDGPFFEEVGPWLAGAFALTAVRDVVGVRAADGAYLLEKSCFGGKAVAQYRLAGRGAVIGVRPGSARAPEGAPAAARTRGLALPAPVATARRSVHDAAGDALATARVIVSGGRGLGSAAAFAELSEAARLLGGALAASRAAVDEGWASPAQQVGITGQKVAPDLYLAVGISGASQHLGGIARARTVLAVNRDPKAPIFAAADFGVVADWQALWPHLRRALGGD